jgi:hypothetical protein
MYFMTSSRYFRFQFLEAEAATFEKISVSMKMDDCESSVWERLEKRVIDYWLWAIISGKEPKAYTED